MKRIARKKAAVTVDEKNPGLLLFLCHYPGVPRQVMSKWYILRMHVIHPDDIKRFGELGTLEVGKLADIVVLDRNLFAVPHKEILETTVKLTMVDGTIVFEK